AYAQIPQVDKGLEVNGRPAGKRVPVPIGAQDVAPYAASALAGGTDGILLATVTADSDKLQQAIRQTGSNIPIIRAGGISPTSSIQTLGAFANNTYIISAWPSVANVKNKGVRQWIREVDKVDKNAPKTDYSMNAWSAVYVFAQAARLAKTIDP